MNYQQLDGYVGWVYGTPPDETYPVQNAVFRNNDELAIDCDCKYEGETSAYTVVLRRKDALTFTGSWTSKSPNLDEGTCECRLYINGDRIACIGSWQENGSTQRWYAELYPKTKPV